MKSNKNKLDQFISNPQKALWSLTIPMMFGLLVNSLYMLVDTYFISNKVGVDGLAALGYVMPFYFIVLGITFGLSSGVTAVIAQYIGEKNKSLADQTAKHSIIIGLSLAIINLLFIILFGKKILSTQGMEIAVLNLASSYFYIMAYGSIFLVLGVFFRAIFLGEGESIIPMAALGIGTVLNIILDPFFINYWGIKGAAIATVISQIVVVLIFLFFIIIKKVNYLDLNIFRFRYNPKLVKKIFNIGIPSCLSMMVMSLGLFIINSILAIDIDVAAYNLANRLENFVILSLIAISTSLVTVVGMFYGAKRYDLIQDIIRYATSRAIFIALFFSFIGYFFMDSIVPFFINMNTSQLDPSMLATNDDVINNTVQYFKVMSFIFPFVGITMVSTRAMQALDRPWPMIIIAFFRVIVLQCSLCFIFIRIMDKDIIWAWYAVAISCVFAALWAYFWRRKVVKEVIF